MLYADDTLLIGKEPKHVEEFARAVEAAGDEYAMALHWGKVQAMPVCSTRKLKQENGEPMKQCDAILTWVVSSATMGKPSRSFLVELAPPTENSES